MSVYIRLNNFSEKKKKLSALKIHRMKIYFCAFKQRKNCCKLNSYSVSTTIIYNCRQGYVAEPPIKGCSRRSSVSQFIVYDSIR